MDRAVQIKIEEEGLCNPLDLARLRDDLRGGFGRGVPANRPSMEVLVLGLAGAMGPGGERAAEALKRGFRPWSKLLTTPPELLAAALRPVEPDLGRALKRAERLIAVVRRLAARSGGLHLDFLGDLSPRAAWDWLEDALALPPALIAAILTCGALRHRVTYPSATAVRALQRLGWAEATDGPGEVGVLLAHAAPKPWSGVDLAELCGLLHSLGEATCHAARPECGACPAASACPSSTAIAPSKPTGALTYLRRRIARMEGEGRPQPTPGLDLGEAFGPAVFPHGFPCGAHQAAPGAAESGAAGQGATPLILAVACALAVERRARAAQAADRQVQASSRQGRLQRRRPPPPEPTAAVTLLFVQEIDAVMEHGELYPPGLQALGLDPDACAFVAVKSGGEVLRVVDEALKLRAAPVLVAELRRGEGLVDLAASRRLNLAARRAGTVLFLMTPNLSNTSAALTRWRVAAAPSQAKSRFSSNRPVSARLGAPAFTFDLVRNRLGPLGSWTVEWDCHEQRFRTSETAGLRPLPAPALPPPVDRPAVAAAEGRVAA